MKEFRMRSLKLSSLAIVGISLLSVAVPGAAASAATRPAAKAASAHAGSASPNLSCPDTGWCIFLSTYYTGSWESGAVNEPLMPYRNQDESESNYRGWLRLYYSPNYAGAWVCIDDGTDIPDTSKYVFNNGAGKAGYGATLWNNVASLTWSSSSSSICSNPIGS
jgi:hypothetical protein